MRPAHQFLKTARSLNSEAYDALTERALNENWNTAWFPNGDTPAHEMLANPTKSMILHGLLGGGVGAAGGLMLRELTGASPGKNALLAGSGAGLGALAGALVGYYGRNKLNEGMLRTMDETGRDPRLEDIWRKIYERDLGMNLPRPLNDAANRFLAGNQYGLRVPMRGSRRFTSSQSGE